MASFTEAPGDAFNFVDRSIDGDQGTSELFPKFSDLTSAKLASPFVHLLEDLRTKYPDHVVTYVNLFNLNLLAYAAAGHATATLDIETDSIFRMRVWQQPIRRGEIGALSEARGFAKYKYHWKDEEFVLYCVAIGLSQVQYVLKERGPGEGQLSHSVITDSLLGKIGLWAHQERKAVYVYDLAWRLDANLYEQMEKASWDKVILDPGMKKDLTSVTSRFFDSKDVYDDLGVPWKRGLIFYGPAGNGKTISIKALMRTLAHRDKFIPTLYVKTAPRTFDIGRIFSLARQMSPCLLVLEDIDTIVTSTTRSYFFNEVDGLANNDGILMVASTNHIDELDPGLSKRPSRFDRKYLFPFPSKAERIQYVQFWQDKLTKRPEVEFPDELVEPIAGITYDFSFAYIQEAFVSALLDIAHRRNEDEEDETSENGKGGGGDDDLEKYELWKAITVQVKVLRDEMEKGSTAKSDPTAPASPPPPQDAIEHHQCASESISGINSLQEPLLQHSRYSGDRNAAAETFSLTEQPYPRATFPIFSDWYDPLTNGISWT